MDTDLVITIIKVSYGDSIIKIFGIKRINGKSEDIAAILSFTGFLTADLTRKFQCFLHHFRFKLQRETCI